MKYSYYPGCTLRNKAKDLDDVSPIRQKQKMLPQNTAIQIKCKSLHTFSSSYHSVHSIELTDYVSPCRGSFLQTGKSVTVPYPSKAHKTVPQQFPLSVPAEMAFGTGDHATTSTCLRFIADFAQSRKETAWTMTDIGCGTAVLAIAALKLGGAACRIRRMNEAR